MEVCACEYFIEQHFERVNLCRMLRTELSHGLLRWPWRGSFWEQRPQAAAPNLSDGLLSLPPNHSSHISTGASPEHCLLVNKCRACLDSRRAHMGSWIKHVGLIKNNLAQKCQGPLRSITPPSSLLLSIFHLTGFKERGPWLARATSREFIQILYDLLVNVLSGIK